MTAVFLDTSVLVNFLRVDQMDLLRRCSITYIVTDHVRGEVSLEYPEQVERLQAALAEGTVEEVAVNTSEEREIFVGLLSEGRFGRGECAAIAATVVRGGVLAIDDKQARARGVELFPGLVVMGTQELMVAMIREELLTVDEADEIKALWATRHRFRLKIGSFEELL